jgi:hypothetical protein
MAKYSFGVDGTEDDAAEGFPQWDGPLPPVGSYSGKFKVAKMGHIKPGSANAGKVRIMLMVEIMDEGPYKGYPAFGGVNVIESGKQFVNQWLRSLTNGSEAEFTAIKKAFWRDGKGLRPGTDFDEDTGHIKRIGKWLVNSPEGQIPVKVTLRHRTWEGNTNAQVQSWLLGAGGFGSASKPVDEPVEEDAAVIDLDEENVDESIFDEEDESEDANA